MPFEELLSSEIRGKLSSLRRVLRAHLVGRGLCWLIVAAVGAVFLTLAIDYPLRLDRAQRALIAALALGGIGYVGWRFLLRPLRVPMDAEELALVLERHYPQLDDRLISSLQFADRPAARAGASEDLIRQVLRQTNALAGQLRPNGPVEAAGTWKRAGFPGGAMCALLAFCIWQWPIMVPWFRRNVLFADEPYPQQTYISVDGGPAFKVVRGGDLTVTVTADPDHVVPDHVTFHMDFPGLGKVDENVPGAAAGANVYAKTFENVADAFYFRITGNDHRTGRFEVLVVNPPELVALSGVKHFPDYMNLQGRDEPFKAEHGIISVPPGTQLLLVGQADKDLASARLLLDGRPVVNLRIIDVPPLDDPRAPRRPRGIKGMLQLPQRIDRSMMVLQFELTDTEGVTNPRGAAYSLRVTPDGPPRVSMNRRHVRDEVTARALIPLVIQAVDDYGLDRVAVSAELGGETPAATRPAPREFEVARVASKERQVSAEYALEVQTLAPKVGQLIRVRGVARDTLPESFGGPNVAGSVVQTYKIVSDQELLAELVRRQKEIRGEFELAVIRQAEVRDKVRAVGDRAALRGIDAETGRNLKAAVKDQRQVAAQCAVTAQQLQEVLDEMIANRVGTPPDRRRLAGAIIAPLAEICEKPMNDVIAEMERASKLTEAPSLRRFAGDVAVILDGFYRRLEAILKQMKELESRQELANRLKVLIDISEQIKQEIRKELQKQTGKLFDPDTQPKP